MEVVAVAGEVDLADAVLIAGVMEDLVPAPGSEEAVEAVDPAWLEVAGFEGKRGQVVAVPHPEASSLLLVGLGDEVSFEGVRAASGEAARKARATRAVTLLARVGLEDATRAVVEGSLLGGYRFDAYKTNDDNTRVERVEIADADSEALARTVVLCEATNLARDWVNTPAKDESPQALAAAMTEAATTTGISVEVWDRNKIEAENLGALLGVAAGSDRDPQVVICDYTPEAAVAHLAFVGKGITFDSGGLSLKTPKGMEEMKVDMAGAAAVVAATVAIARLGLPVRVTTITPLTDNAVGGDATRPGDVLRPVDGPTIEVTNTDAEGRLILADGLGLARRYQPDVLVDVATLTGAAHVALGDKYAAAFVSDPDLAEKVLTAASRAGEYFWELPLEKDYRKFLESTVADIKNSSSSRYGGAIVAAVFLSEYAGDGSWAHLDIAGPSMARETSGEQVKGGSGIGVRTLVELAEAMARSG
ncbi:MAG: leucyl aminopeptidase [Acidimicrobiia bacterium]